MRLDEIKTPFQWNQDASLLNSRNLVCKQNRRYKLITPNDRLLPFIIRFLPNEGTAPGPAAMTIINSDTGAETNANAITINIGHYRIGGTWNYYVYNGDQIAGLTLAPGYYYAVLTLADDTTFTSEEFWIDCDTSGADFSRDWSADFSEDFGPLYTLGGLRKYTKIQWWHSCDIGNLLYQTGFQNVLYVDSELVRDEPEILEEGDEDGNKDFITTSIKYTDKIAMVDLLPDHVLNAMLLIPAHDHVLITTKKDLYIGKAKRFACKFDQISGCFSKVDMNFQLEYSLFSKGCCTNNNLETLTS